MSKRSKEKKPALADWTVCVQGLVSTSPVTVPAASLRRHKDGSYTFRDGAGNVVFDAPHMRVIYAQRIAPEVSPAQTALAAEAARTELAAKRGNGGPEIRPVKPHSPGKP